MNEHRIADLVVELKFFYCFKSVNRFETTVSLDFAVIERIFSDFGQIVAELNGGYPGFCKRKVAYDFRIRQISRFKRRPYERICADILGFSEIVDFSKLICVDERAFAYRRCRIVKSNFLGKRSRKCERTYCFNRFKVKRGKRRTSKSVRFYSGDFREIERFKSCCVCKRFFRNKIFNVSFSVFTQNGTAESNCFKLIGKRKRTFAEFYAVGKCNFFEARRKRRVIVIRCDKFAVYDFEHISIIVYAVFEPVGVHSSAAERIIANRNNLRKIDVTERGACHKRIIAYLCTLAEKRIG